jgi:hypothetical protein
MNENTLQIDQGATAKKGELYSTNGELSTIRTNPVTANPDKRQAEHGPDGWAPQALPERAFQLHGDRHGRGRYEIRSECDKMYRPVMVDILELVHRRFV